MLYSDSTPGIQKKCMPYDDGYDDDYQISVGCKNYSPKGTTNIMDMTDYTTCDNCRHLRQDNRCGIAERTLF